jgi:hypothetical protein
MKALKVIVRVVEGSWKLGLALIIVSGYALAIYRMWLSEAELYREWIEWVPNALILGGGIVVLSGIARLAQRVQRHFASNRATREQAEAGKQAFELARKNLASLVREERLLLLEALKRYPYQIEVLEFGPSQSLVKKEILCIVGESTSTMLVCKVHPWLAQYRDELIRIIETNR